MAFLSLLLVSFVAYATAFTNVEETLFKHFMIKHNRVYETVAEQERRFNIFLSNLERANMLNDVEGNSVHGVTQFMDLTPIEFKQYLGFFPKLSAESSASDDRVMSTGARPTCSNATNCNYAQLGAVSPVKDQGQCGSCWAFSTTQAVETAWWFAGHNLPILSPQELVDCDTTDAGCNGGDPPSAYAWIIKNGGGMMSEASYPYTATDGKCKFQESEVVANISSWAWAITPCNTLGTLRCTNQDEPGLWTFVQNKGPTSICVDAEPWQTYTGGIFSKGCTNSYASLDHCVGLTGYGVDKGQKYWLVKNSWGTSWGEDGYIRLAYGSNVCGVADEVTYAVV